jgi:hypothetical protein
MLLRYERMGMREVDDYCSRKSSDGRAWKSLAVGMFLGNGTEVRMGSTYKQGESSRGEER